LGRWLSFGDNCTLAYVHSQLRIGMVEKWSRHFPVAVSWHSFILHPPLSVPCHISGSISTFQVYFPLAGRSRQMAAVWHFIVPSHPSRTEIVIHPRVPWSPMLTSMSPANSSTSTTKHLPLIAKILHPFMWVPARLSFDLQGNSKLSDVLGL
jgi:hypothetical protein